MEVQIRSDSDCIGHLEDVSFETKLDGRADRTERVVGVHMSTDSTNTETIEDIQAVEEAIKPRILKTTSEVQISVPQSTDPPLPSVLSSGEKPRTVFHIEQDDVPGVGKMVKPYRRFYGRPSKKMQLEKVEIEYDSQASPRCPLYTVELEPDEGPEGASARAQDGRVYTFEPERYGDPVTRVAAGKKVPQELQWDEWNLLT